MRIFLSYSRADAKVAELIVASLKQAGHEVFFDRHELNVAEDFNRVIWKEIQKAGLFVFLISPNSVKSGSYTLTELALVEKRWPNPDRRVLAVVIEATGYTSIPLYVTLGHILYPKGDMAFEVRVEVDSLAKKHRLRKLGRLTAIAAGVLLMGSCAMLGYREYLEQRPFAARERLVAMHAYDTKNFIETAFKGDVKLMELYLTAGMDPNTYIVGTQEEGISALMMAVIGKHPEIVEMLLEAGADVNAMSKWGDTALSYAVDGGQDICLRKLLAAGVDADIANRAFVRSAMTKNINTSGLRMLLDYGVSKTAIDEAFVEAAGKGHHSLLHTLSNRITDQSKVASSALLKVSSISKEVFHELPESAQIETFKYLLELGADVNALDENGVTSLSLAVHNQNLKLVKILLKNHASANIRDKCLENGHLWTPLTLAIEKAVSTLSADEHMEMASMAALLLASGADVNLAMGECLDDGESDDRTPLMLAATGNDMHFVLTLLKNGANVNAQDRKGYSALAYATNNGNILALLLKSGADMHAGTNPLLTVVEQNKYQGVERLLKAGADVNKKDDKGTTPLMMAAKIANPDMIRLLLNAGARATDKDNLGRTAETFSRRERANKITEMLRNAKL